MVQRRRYATRDELVQMLVDRGADQAAITTLLDMLAEFGVDPDALVKITVGEPEPDVS